MGRRAGWRTLRLDVVALFATQRYFVCQTSSLPEVLRNLQGRFGPAEMRCCGAKPEDPKANEDNKRALHWQGRLRPEKKCYRPLKRAVKSVDEL